MIDCKFNHVVGGNFAPTNLLKMSHNDENEISLGNSYFCARISTNYVVQYYDLSVFRVTNQVSGDYILMN